MNPEDDLDEDAAALARRQAEDRETALRLVCQPCRYGDHSGHDQNDRAECPGCICPWGPRTDENNQRKAEDHVEENRRRAEAADTGRITIAAPTNPQVHLLPWYIVNCARCAERWYEDCDALPGGATEAPALDDAIRDWQMKPQATESSTARNVSRSRRARRRATPGTSGCRRGPWSSPTGRSDTAPDVTTSRSEWSRPPGSPPMHDTQEATVANSSPRASARRRGNTTAPIFAALASVYPTTRWSIKAGWAPLRARPVLLRSSARAAIPAGPSPASTVRIEAATGSTGNSS
jgi:hypothetical protein